MDNVINYDKNIFVIARNENCAHKFVFNSKEEYYDKGDRAEINAAKHLAKHSEDGLVIKVKYTSNFDESWEIIENLNEVFKIKGKFEDFGFIIENIIENIDEL